jgi:hypothetical protein
MKTIKNIFIAIIAIATTTSCVNDTWDTPKQDTCIAPVDAAGVALASNKAVTAVWTAAPVVASAIPYPANDIIEGYVISSEEGGNFYKNMYIQPLDGSKGLNLSINVGDLYNNKFEPGRKVFLKLQGLAYANPPGFARGLVFGDAPTDIYTVDRLAETKYKNHLISTCDVINEDAIVKNITITQALSDTYLNNLVEISGVQFKSNCGTYSTQASDTSLQISDGVSPTTLLVRTSKFANFAGEQVPAGNGKIRGVLTKYGTGNGASTYQIILRTQRDVKMINPRVQVATPAKLGAGYTTFNATLSENFSAATILVANDATVPKYINHVEIGTKYWDVKTFGGNKYIQTSAFNNGCVKNYFIFPVDFTAANKMSFKTLDGYNNGQPLKVYLSTTYVPGAAITAAMLNDISSSFTFADGRPTTASAYASTFTSSGSYSFPASLTGNGYIIFEYDGTTGITTTSQIDDIIIN